MRKFLLPLVALLLPSLASAHEVYVLTPQQIVAATTNPPFDMVAVALADMHNFIFWGFITFIVISTIFFVSIFRRLENLLDPLFAWGKVYAHTICRITVGVGLLAGAYNQATYGPELPFLPAWGVLTPIITALTATIGLCLLANVWVRPAAFVALGFFSYAVFRNGEYMLTYTNYLGEFLVLLLLGMHGGKKPAMRTELAKWWARVARLSEPYAFLIIRVAFGASLLYAAFYAKIIHNNLALDVASLPLAGHPFGLAHYLGFEPHFLVLGAALIEIIISMFFILGIEIRWTCIFLEFWLSLSLWWFGESVWPHFILIGIPIALFFHGYDKYSLEGIYFKKGKREPVF